MSSIKSSRKEDSEDYMSSKGVDASILSTWGKLSIISVLICIILYKFVPNLNLNKFQHSNFCDLFSKLGYFSENETPLLEIKCETMLCGRMVSRFIKIS